MPIKLDGNSLVPKPFSDNRGHKWNILHLVPSDRKPQGMTKDTVFYTNNLFQMIFFGKLVKIRLPYSAGNDSVYREKDSEHIISGSFSFKLSYFQFDIKNIPGSHLSHVVPIEIKV